MKARLALAAGAALMLGLTALAWWGWQRGGLALLQLNMSLC
ncbi:MULTISPECIES: hypothetical protein [Pseudomonadaceae]|nr:MULTISPECIES: hypothetical protein [Pseudomonas]